MTAEPPAAPPIWDNRVPGSCPCGFLARPNCLYVKQVNVCDYPSAEPPPPPRYGVWTYTRRRP